MQEINKEEKTWRQIMDRIDLKGLMKIKALAHTAFLRYSHRCLILNNCIVLTVPGTLQLSFHLIFIKKNLWENVLALLRCSLEPHSSVIFLWQASQVWPYLGWRVCLTSICLYLRLRLLFLKFAFCSCLWQQGHLYPTLYFLNLMQNWGRYLNLFLGKNSVLSMGMLTFSWICCLIL